MSGTSARRVHAVLSADLLPWERQPEEGERAYEAFKAWLDSDHRRVRDHGPSALNWSSEWCWSARAHEYDIYISRVDLEEQVRYRQKMNERHRRMAAVAQSKVLEWLGSVDPTKMSAADATRLLDVAVRIERAATRGAVSAEDLPDPHSEPAGEGSLEQRLIDAGLDVPMSEIAQLLHEKLGPPARVSESFSERPRQAQTDAAPRQAQDDAAPLPDETSDESVWGDR
jgi:hypothetical protein